MPRHQPATPLTDKQRQLVEDNYKLVFAAMKKYYSPRRTLDRELLQAEFGFALCNAARTYSASKGSFSGWAFWWFKNAFLVLLRKAYTRGITGTGKEIKCRTAEMKDRLVWPDTRLSDLEEMRADFEEVRWMLPKVEQEVITRRMKGESFRQIGKAFDFSKQRAEQYQIRAIKILGQAN